MNHTIEDAIFIVGKTLKHASEHNLDLVKGNMKYLQAILKRMKKLKILPKGKPS